jgi:hypothetical protein
MITICGKKYSTETTHLILYSLTTIPKEIKYLTNLKHLVLSDNKITAMREHIFDSLINLETLDFSANKITAIPEHIFDQLINLKELYLHNNEITSIPEHLFDSLTNLKHLSLSDNEITSIPEHIFDSLTNLKYLSLSYNQITSIPEHIFDHLTNLHSLYLSGNKITTIPEHIFDSLTKLLTLYLCDNEITAMPISILNCKLLRDVAFFNNPIERLDVRIRRFIGNIRKPKPHIFIDSKNVNSSVKVSIDNLMMDAFTMDKKDIVKQLVEESPVCLESLLSYLDNAYIHSTLYLTFFEVFEKVWGRIIGSDFKADLIKRLDEEMMDSECKCFTGRISRLVNVLVGFFSDITISSSERIGTNISSVLSGREIQDEKIGTIISSVLNGREMSDELKEVCRKSLKEADIKDYEIAEWLDIKIFL